MCGVQRRFGLTVPLLRIARIDLHQERAGLHHRARLHRHRGNLTRSLGANLDRVDRLDDAGGFDINDDVLPLHRRGLDLRCLCLLLLAPAEGERCTGEKEERRYAKLHGKWRHGWVSPRVRVRPALPAAPSRHDS